MASRPRRGLRCSHALQICLSIDPDPLVPDALSRQQLSSLLKAATEGAEARLQSIDEDELLRAALSAWADQTKELLQWIESQGDAVSETRSAKQVMALGSFRTHLVMGQHCDTPKADRLQLWQTCSRSMVRLVSTCSSKFLSSALSSINITAKAAANSQQNSSVTASQSGTQLF